MTGLTSPPVAIPHSLLINDAVKSVFQNSTYWKGNICLRFQVIATPLHLGCCIAYFQPNISSAHAGSSSRNAALFAPSVFLNANSSASVCLNVPFCAPTEYAYCNYLINPNNTDAANKVKYNNFMLSKFSSLLGNVYLQVLNPLQASAATTVYISLYAEFKDMDFRVPRNGFINALAAEPPAAKTQKTMTSIKTKRGDEDDQNLIFGKDFPVSEAVNDIEPEASILATIGMAALPNVISNVKDGIDRLSKKFFKWIGLDKPTVPIVDHQVRITTSTNYNTSEGACHTDRMTLFTSHVNLAKPDLFPSEQDEMDMSYLLSRKGYVTNFKVLGTDLSSTLLCTIPIGPQCVKSYSSAGGQGFDGPLITRFSYMFKYWRGTIDYHFHFVASDVHSIKLMFVKTYGLGLYTTTPSMLDLAALDTEIVEFNKGGQEVVISCPFNAPCSMLPNDPDYFGSTRNHGSLFVFVLTPLQYTAAVANNAQFNVYVTAGEDFAFYGPAETLGIIADSNIGFGIEPESGEISAEPAFNVAEAIETNTDTRSDGLTTSLPPIRHLRTPMRRYYQLANFTPIPTFTNIALSDIFTSRGWSTMLACYAHMFGAYKGGLRFRVVFSGLLHSFPKPSVYYKHPTLRPTPTTQQNFGVNQTPGTDFDTAASYATNTTSKSTAASQPVTMVSYNQVDNTLDFEIVNENLFRFNRINTASNTPNNDTLDYSASLGNIIIAFPEGYAPVLTTGIPSMRVYVSLSDEGRFGLAYALPSIYLRTNNDFTLGIPAVEPTTPDPNLYYFSKGAL